MISYTSSPSPSPSPSFCKAWPSHPTYCTVIFVVRTASAALSLLGCLFMIFIICLFKKYQFFVQRLILWLSIAALLDTIGYLMIPEVIKPNGYCTFMAFWQEYIDWSVLLWIYHLIGWGFPLVIACIPFSDNSYGAATTMCWIRPEHNVMRFAIWYVPFFILLAACLAAYVYVLVIIKRRSKVWSGSYNPETERKLILLKEDVKPLRFYPLAYISLNVFPFINSLFVIFIIVLFRKYHFFSQRLVLWLSVAALLDSIGYIISEPRTTKDTSCIFEAFWMTFFDWTVLLWVSCIIFNLFWNVVKHRRTNSLEWVYHLISWGMALVIACLPFSNGIVYGPAGLWCWIQYGYNGWRFGIWFVPLFVGVGIMVVVYSYIVILIRRRSKQWEAPGTCNPEEERAMAQLKEDVKLLRLYPLVYLLANFFPLINRIQNASSPDKQDNPIFTLTLLHALTNPLQGALNALVYGCDKETLSKLTWTHIKSAVMQLGKHSIVKEYPVETTVLVNQTSAHQDDDNSDGLLED